MCVVEVVSILYPSFDFLCHWSPVILWLWWSLCQGHGLFLLSEGRQAALSAQWRILGQIILHNSF